jgi:hypothetical protein
MPTPRDPTQLASDTLPGDGDPVEADAIAEALAAALIETLAPVAPSPDLRRRLMTALEGADRFRPFWPQLAELLALPVAAVRAALARIDEPGAWSKVLPGISSLGLAAGSALAGAQAVLLRLRPGVIFPRHEHLGAETALVLEGAGHDEGQIYTPGMIIQHATGTTHEFRAGDNRDLLLVVLHHGVQFR